jgi:hypothetical protein
VGAVLERLTDRFVREIYGTDRRKLIRLVMTPYNEQYTAWHRYEGGPAGLTEYVTLTHSDLINFGN